MSIFRCNSILNIFAAVVVCLCLSPNVLGQVDEPAKRENVYVLMQTSLGDITLELNAERAPVSVENFVKYVEAGHFNDTVFHRVIQDFMIQGGGFDKGDMTREKKTNAPIKNEAGNGLKNDKYTIAMARTSDPDSATSQFFINTKNNTGLNRPNPDGYGYAVFGKVIAGEKTVDAIAASPVTMKNGERSFPLRPLIIKEVKVIDKPELESKP